MCFLSERDRRQLKANLWRTKTVLGRQKGKVQTQLIQPIVLLSILVILKFTVMISKESKITPFADNDWTVTNSATPGTSTWPEETTLQTNFNLQNCTVNAMTNIGLIKPDGEEY